MTYILIIEKNGDIKSDKILDTINSYTTNLYKKCSFRKVDGFEKIMSWNANISSQDIIIELWGRSTGKILIKNSYVFPLKVDKIVYGNCLLVGKCKEQLIDLSIDMWNEIYYNLNNTDIDSILN